MYAGMCQEIGKPQQVASRRDRINEIDCLMNKIAKLIIGNQLEIMVSGSKKEGLRLRGSDIDIMFWPSDYRVIWDYSQSQLYSTQRQTLIFVTVRKVHLDSTYFGYHQNMLNYSYCRPVYR